MQEYPPDLLHSYYGLCGLSFCGSFNLAYVWTKIPKELSSTKSIYERVWWFTTGRSSDRPDSQGSSPRKHTQSCRRKRKKTKPAHGINGDCLGRRAFEIATNFNSFVIPKTWWMKTWKPKTWRPVAGGENVFSCQNVITSLVGGG